MTDVADLSAVPSWFVVLPDCEPAREVAAIFRPLAAQEVAHPSGRPWLIGRFLGGSPTTGAANQTRVAAVGQHAVTRQELDQVARQIRRPTDLARTARSLVGSFHLIASINGEVRVQGTVTGIRRVFEAKLGGVTVAADQANTLAAAMGASIDEQALALHLLEPPILYPFAGRPVWEGVRALPTHDYLLLDERGGARSVRWWSPPEPHVPLAEGAVALREALRAAVAARARRREVVSCDLGGLDSTAICCLALLEDAPTVAYTAECHDPEADDARWAARTVAALGDIEHHLIPPEEVPLFYDRVFDSDDLFDEPFEAAVDRSRLLVSVRRAAERGSRMHLTGYGGDELLYGSLAHLHSLAKSNPRVAWRSLRGFATKYRWPRREILRQLSDRGSYATWLAQIADKLSEPPPPSDSPLLQWGFEPRLPPWAAPDTVDAVRDLIRSEAATVEPLAETRGQHRELETMRFVSRIVRHAEQMAARLGVAFAAPYYDDRVIEAGLAVRPEERITPWRYKPVIVEAMHDIVPQETLARQTKAHASYEEDIGLRENRADLLSSCEDSRLAALGLIDVDALREAIVKPLPPELDIFALHKTMACEVWLRTLERASDVVGESDGVEAA